MNGSDAIVRFERAHRGKSLRFVFELGRSAGLPEEVVQREESRLVGAPVVRDAVRVLGDLFGQKGAATWSCNLDVRLLRADDPRPNPAMTAKAARQLADRHSALAYPGAPFLSGASAKDLVTALDWLASGHTPAGAKVGFGDWLFIPGSLRVVKVPAGTPPQDVVDALAPVLVAAFGP